MKTKKILFVATVVKTHINTFHIKNMEYFKGLGYEVHVAAKNDFVPKNSLNIPNCDVYHDIDFPRNPFSTDMTKAYSQLKKVIDVENFELIHCNTPVGGLLARIAARQSRRNSGTKILYQAHGFHFFKGAPLKNWMLFYPVERLMARDTDCLLVINQEDFKRGKSFKCQQVQLVNGVGVEIDKFHNASGNLREKYMISKETKIICSIGELNKNKNHITVIESLARIKAEVDKNFIYFICGEGAQRRNIEEKVKELDLKDNVILLGYSNEVPKILADADLFVFPSYREGLPVSVMEAMSAGVPVVASNIRGNRDLIENKVNGELFDLKNKEQLDDILKSFFNNSLPVKEYVSNSYMKIQDFETNKVLIQMSDIYDMLLGREEVKCKR
ncbi:MULTISPECIES: glycosyltransferase family 4 protein [Enterococcus]|uniref:glycosyltransferase family 4 protein n=1 Tax=Enterococcus TaxID=1350 RepID=UPI000303ADA9|nr:glycosyltransferase family 4 protein [Enterococcus mundtii]OBS61817.1 hypothetical protein AX758_12315 [Enterococcus mundtii]